jgi:hypothetical protein
MYPAPCEEQTPGAGHHHLDAAAQGISWGSLLTPPNQKMATLLMRVERPKSEKAW